MRERHLLPLPDAARIATPALAAAQTRFVAVHPWDDQLKGLQASDAASQLVLAVAAASAASPGERAQAGQFPWPYYLIGTRDSFTNELVKVQTQVSLMKLHTNTFLCGSRVSWVACQCIFVWQSQASRPVA